MGVISIRERSERLQNLPDVQMAVGKDLSAKFNAYAGLGKFIKTTNREIIAAANGAQKDIKSFQETQSENNKNNAMGEITRRTSSGLLSSVAQSGSFNG